MGLIRRGPQPAAVRFDDRAADRQPHAHAGRLGREEGIEQPVQVVRVDANAGVVDGQSDVLTVVRLRADRSLTLIQSAPYAGE